MDPTATLECIEAYARVRDLHKADEYCAYLCSWLAQRGFEPTWSRFRIGAMYFASWKRRHHTWSNYQDDDWTVE